MKWEQGDEETERELNRRGKRENGKSEMGGEKKVGKERRIRKVK
jgi:hypothetical protein